MHTEVYEEIKKLYGDEIVGYPTYLVVNPQTGQVIKKWSIDIDQMSLEGIEEAFEKPAKEYSETMKQKTA